MMTALLLRDVGLRVATLGILLLACSIPLHAQQSQLDGEVDDADAKPSNVAVEFEKPYRIFADGKAIDTDVGHAAPLVTDFDGDGLKDLLVGQFGDGILTIYRNTGSNSQPEYSAGVEFMDGSDGDGRIPTA